MKIKTLPHLETKDCRLRVKKNTLSHVSKAEGQGLYLHLFPYFITPVADIHLYAEGCGIDLYSRVRNLSLSCIILFQFLIINYVDLDLITRRNFLKLNIW
jgi:hypothetical protein